jgi:hypothetical protein
MAHGASFCAVVGPSAAAERGRGRVVRPAHCGVLGSRAAAVLTLFETTRTKSIEDAPVDFEIA